MGIDRRGTLAKREADEVSGNTCTPQGSGRIGMIRGEKWAELSKLGRQRGPRSAAVQ